MGDESENKENEECRDYPVTYACPICGLPIEEGRCPGGCPAEVHTLKLTELPKYLKNVDSNETEIVILNKSEPYYPLDEQYVTVQLSAIFAEPQRKLYQLYLSSAFDDTQYIQYGIFNLLTVYLYRRDCGYVEKIVGKWKGERRKRKKKPRTIKLTKNVYDMLHKASEYYRVDLAKLIDYFIFEVYEEISKGLSTDGKNSLI